MEIEVEMVFQFLNVEIANRKIWPPIQSGTGGMDLFGSYWRVLPAAAEMESKQMKLEMEEQLRPKFVTIKFSFLFLANSQMYLASFSKVLCICMKHVSADSGH